MLVVLYNNYIMFIIVLYNGYMMLYYNILDITIQSKLCYYSCFNSIVIISYIMLYYIIYYVI